MEGVAAELAPNAPIGVDDTRRPRDRAAEASGAKEYDHLDMTLEYGGATVEVEGGGIIRADGLVSIEGGRVWMKPPKTLG